MITTMDSPNVGRKTGKVHKVGNTGAFVLVAVCAVIVDDDAATESLSP